MGSGSHWLFGVQPVLEALKGKETKVEKVWIAYGRSGEGLRKLLALASRRKVPVSFKDRPSLDEKAGTTKHQGVLALLAEIPFQRWEGFFAGLPAGTARFLALLDEVQDPHNLGAILRTAWAVGLEGLLLPKHRSSPVTPVVVKASAGTAGKVPLVRVGNAIHALERARAKGMTVVGADPRGEVSLFDADLRRDLCLVIGGEGRGLRPAVRKQCDLLVSIPMTGDLDSLNVSVAAAVLFYEVLRQRREGRGGGRR